MSRLAPVLVALSSASCAGLAGLGEFEDQVESTGGAGGSTSSGGAGATTGGGGSVNLPMPEVLYEEGVNLLPVLAGRGSEVFVVRLNPSPEILRVKTASGEAKVYADAVNPVIHLIATDRKIAWATRQTDGCGEGFYTIRTLVNNSSTPQTVQLGCQMVPVGMDAQGESVIFSMVDEDAGVQTNVYEFSTPIVALMKAPPAHLGPLATLTDRLYVGGGSDALMYLFDTIRATEVDPIYEPRGELTAIDADGSGVSFSTNSGIVATLNNNRTITIHADDQTDVRDLVRDDRAVYWTDSSVGKVFRAEDDMTTYQVIATDQTGPRGLAVVGESVVWVNAAPGQTAVMKLDLSGL